jgi:hypothetical protein
VAEHGLLTIVQLPTYVPELNPVQGHLVVTLARP